MEQIPYTESFGPVEFPEGFLETLHGLSLQQQAKHFRLIKSSSSRFGGDWRERHKLRHSQPLDDNHTVIVKDGLLAGVVLYGPQWQRRYCLVEKGVITAEPYDTPEFPGMSWVEYTCLLCVPPEYEDETF